jgi:ribosomal protein S18 acetylase RimI-like enzyme
VLFGHSSDIAHLRHQEPTVAQAIVALQRRAYRPEADLLDFPGLPPLKESPADIIASVETFYGLTTQGRLIALAATEACPEGTVITRLCVAPGHVRRGHAARLIRHVVEQSRGPVKVTTAAGNHPAIALYEKCGFVIQERHDSYEGLKLVTLRRPEIGPRRDA